MNNLKHILLAAVIMLPAFSSVVAAKKTTVQTFPDGTPINEWFLNAEAPSLSDFDNIYNLADYGIYSSPVDVQTAQIQSVIDKAAETGGLVFVPEGIYKSGALFFPQGTHLYLTKGAVLLGSDRVYDFPVQMTRIEGQTCMYLPALINGDNLDGFCLFGEGTIDGNGSDYWRAFRMRRQWNPKCTNKDEMRPRLVHFENCSHITISGLSLQNSPFWTCHLYKCSFVKLLNVRYFSPRRPIASASADGVDMDVCHDVLIKGCRFTVNDDAVCFKGGKGPYADKDDSNGPCYNVLVEDCLFDKTTGSCMTCGSEAIHVHNVLMRRCEATGSSNLLQLKMRPDTPQHYEYITIEDFKGKANRFLNLTEWRQFFDLQGREDIPMSYADHIVFQRINLECGTFIAGKRNDEQYLLSDFVFHDLNVITKDTQKNQELFQSCDFKNVVLQEPVSNE